MITLDEFNKLDDHNKGLVLSDGFYLKMRMEEGLRVMLYTFQSFYEEVYYDTVAKAIVKIIGFNSNKILAKFIKL